ncbi:MAG: porin family protein [Segetibacter sp.]|nr:porin family protein [Segetibacter sp.]
MDENLHRIDDLFKKALEEHSETPSPKVWENLDKNLEKKKIVSITKKYKKWKWVAAALFIFSFGMAMYAWNLKLRYREVAKKNKEKTTNTINSNGREINEKQRDTSTGANSYKDLARGKTTEKMDVTPGTATNNENGIAKTSEIEKAGTARAETAVKKGKETEVNTGRQMNIAANDKTKHSRKAASKKQEIKSTKDDNARTVSINGPVKKNKTIRDTVKDLRIDDRLKIVETSIAGRQKQLPEVNAPAILQMDKSALSMTQGAARQNTKTPKIKVEKQGLYTVTFLVSTQRVSTDLRDDRPRFREDDRREIKRKEKIKSSWSIGALIGRRIGSKLTLQTGVSLVTRVTDIDSKKIFARPDNRGNVNFRISCSSGYAYVSTKAATAPASGDSISSISTATTLQYLSVPLGLQYQFRAGSFTISPAVAVAANFKTKGKIETVLSAPGGNEKAGTNIEGLKPYYFDGSLRLDLAYDFTKAIGITLMPAARFGLSSITKDGPVKTYVNSLGVGLGLNVHF